MKENTVVKRVLRSIYHYLIFFFLAATVITCCMLLFLWALTRSVGVVFTQEDLELAATLTFCNVVFLSLIFTVIDSIRRKITVDIPVRRITQAAEKIMQGDFSVRIPTHHRFSTDEKFLQVMECFNKMTQELDSVETLRTDFIANVSHEMKTPLAVIQNYATLLQGENVSREQRLEYAGGIGDNSRRLADMVTNILKLNCLENQQIFPNTAEYDLGEQLCDCLLQYEQVWENAGIEIDTDIAQDVRIWADAELLSLVWNNLLSNAFKFTPPGGQVFVSLSIDGRQVCVKVRDTGCGMSQEVGTHIFEKFYQGDSSHATRGNGLGLALVKRVMDIMQGEIRVESAPGKGSTFTVKLQRDLR